MNDIYPFQRWFIQSLQKMTWKFLVRVYQWVSYGNDISHCDFSYHKNFTTNIALYEQSHYGCHFILKMGIENEIIKICLMHYNVCFKQSRGYYLKGKKSCGTKKRGIKQIFAVHILLNLRKTSRVRYSRFLVA